eukprot:192149_1
MSHGLTLFVLISTIKIHYQDKVSFLQDMITSKVKSINDTKTISIQWSYKWILTTISFGDGQQYYKYFGVSGECGLQCGGIDQYASVTGIEEYYKLYTMLY